MWVSWHRESHGSCAIVSSCLRGSEIFFLGCFVGPKLFLLGVSWVRNFFSGVFRGSKTFSRGFFLGPRFFLVGVLWIQIFFSLVFRGSKIFSRGSFLGPKFFLAGLLWVQNFFSWVFCGEIKTLISYSFKNSIVRSCKFLLVYWNRIISFFLKVIHKLIHEAYTFCCSLIRWDRNKGNFAHGRFYLWQNYVDNTASRGKHGTWELKVWGASVYFF